MLVFELLDEKVNFLGKNHLSEKILTFRKMIFEEVKRLIFCWRF